MSNIEFLANEISSRYGSVKRARKCFLYTAKGIRLVDMFQEEGRAILGWEGDSAFTSFKNVLCRGIAGSFNTDFSYRTKKALQDLFASEREIFIFYSKEEALKCSLKFSAQSTSIYRPWSFVDIKWSEIESIVYAPVLPWAEPIFIVAVKPECLNKLSENGQEIPSGRRLPAPLQAAISRSTYNLIAALQERQEKNWFLYDKVLCKYWERKGPYLIPKVKEEKYQDFVKHCLDCGLVISPDYGTPSIIPYGADPGVFTKLKNSEFNS